MILAIRIAYRRLTYHFQDNTPVDLPVWSEWCAYYNPHN
jgi:hypothetical protein